MSIYRNIKLLTWFNFFSDFKLYAPLAIIYFSNIAGSYVLGTSILSIAMISSALFEVPTGIFSDLIGRKKTIILGAIASFLAISLYAIGSFYWILALGAILEGLSRSFYSGNNDALLHDSLSEVKMGNKYHHYLGRITSGLQIGLGISALLGSLVVAWNFQAVFWLSAFSQFICLILSLGLIEPKIKGVLSGNVYKHLKESFIYFIRNPKLRLLSISSVVSFGLGEAAFQFRPAFYAGIWPVWALGIATGLNNFQGVIGFYISGWAIDKFGGLRILMLGAIYNRIISFIALIFASVFSPILLSTTSLHWGISSTAKNSLMQKEFTSHQRATMGSLNSFAGSIFFAIVATFLGLVADKLTPGFALITMEVFLLGNLYIYWKLFKNNSS